MFKKYFFRLFSTLIIFLSLLAGALGKPQETLALNISDYFTYSYDFKFYKADKQTPLDFATVGETFYARVSGTATCIQDPPLPGAVTSARLVIKIIARLDSSEVGLNERFELSYSPFPTKGQTVSDTRDVPLTFPAGSSAGTYNLFGKVLEANLTLLGIIPYNAIGLLPPGELEKPMGTIGCGIPAPVVTGGSGSTGAGGGITQSVTEPVTYLTSMYFPDGTLKDAVVAKSLDGRALLNLVKGIKIIDANGETVGALAMYEVKKENEPQPPDGNFIIGKAYDLRPNGITFSQPVSITFSFDPAQLPERVQEKDIVIVWWNSTENKWVPLTDCKVDEEANTVSATVDHFTVFTLTAKPTPPIPPAPTTTPTTQIPTSTSPTPTLPTSPATTTSPTSPVALPASSPSFTVSDFTIIPGEITVGENVSVSVLITNPTNITGIYTVTLKLDNIPSQTRQVTLEGKASQEVKFAVKGDIAGIHTVSVGEIPGTFIVNKASSQSSPSPARTINWWILGALVVVGLIMGVTGFILRRQNPWHKVR